LSRFHNKNMKWRVSKSSLSLRVLSRSSGWDFGGGSDAAVRLFQAAKQLTTDGEVGQQTWASLFPDVPIPAPAILDDSVQFRCMALTGSFETDQFFPDCFAGLSGDFDGQGISFGVLQWNLGQGSLQPLLQKINTTDPDLVESIFGPELCGVQGYARSAKIRATAVGSFNSKLEACADRALFNGATALCKDFGLLSTRAAALMFDIKVQNGSISDRVKAQIEVSRDDAEVERLRIIANRRASAAKAKWVEDVRARKLTIANGQGMVHGNFYDLKEQYGLGLEPF